MPSSDTLMTTPIILKEICFSVRAFDIKANSTGFNSAKQGGASPIVLPFAMANMGSFPTWISEKQSLHDRKPPFLSLSQTTKVARGDN